MTSNPTAVAGGEHGPPGDGGLELRPLPGATFGAEALFAGAGDAPAVVAAAETEPDLLPRALYQSHGLLVLRGMRAISDRPELLVRLSRLFGPEVEDYHQTLTASNKLHDRVAEILVLSNMPPFGEMPPPRPIPPRDENGGLPVQFPHRRGWHTDQSFRRPPPDISLFYAVLPAPRGQGQTLYADGMAAYQALPPALKARADGLEGLHVVPGTGRSVPAVRAGETPQPLLPHQRAQRQPVVRVHPVTGKPALYLCEYGQMDWVDGPFVGMPPGPDGEAAELLEALMAHYTRPEFVYVHDWDEGDLVIYDNRSLVHAGTWYDAAEHKRLMWRTTVRGNPGPEYTGEKRSWIPDSGARPMAGLDA